MVWTGRLLTESDVADGLPLDRRPFQAEYRHIRERFAAPPAGVT